MACDAEVDPQSPEGFGVYRVTADKDGEPSRLGGQVENDQPIGDYRTGSQLAAPYAILEPHFPVRLRGQRHLPHQAQPLPDIDATGGDQGGEQNLAPDIKGVGQRGDDGQAMHGEDARLQRARAFKRDLERCGGCWR